MTRLVEQAHAIATAALVAGDWAIDATAGNGGDALVLAHAVGPTGRVFAFDKQATAIQQTRKRIEAAEVDWVTLVEACHSRIEELVPEDLARRFGAVMFNLGFLPGGDQCITTQVESTLAALRASLRILSPGGVVTVIGYTGHAGGLEETQAVETWFDGLPKSRFTRLGDLKEPLEPPAPRLMAARRNY